MINNPTVKNILETAYIPNATPRVLAEWNLNGYVDDLDHKVTNAEIDEDYIDGIPNAGMDTMFPIESITDPFRFGWGINKTHTLMKRGRTATAPVLLKYGWDGYAWKDRWYIPGDWQKYRFYASQRLSDMAGNITGFNPRVIYGSAQKANKIVIKLNGPSRPTVWNVLIKTAGGWTTVAVNPTVPTTGTTPGIVELWHQGNGTWSTNPVYWTSASDNTVDVYGVGIDVTRIVNPEYRAELVEIYAAFEANLTEYLISYDTSYELGDKDMMSPIGTMSANTGTVTLDNSDGIFNYNNTSSIFYKKMDANVRFIIDLTIQGQSSSDTVRQATMMSDTGWETIPHDTTTINLIDYSKILMQRSAQDTYIKNYRFSNVVAQVLDSVGFGLWDKIGGSPDDYVNFFWCKEEETVWEVLQKLASAHQAALAFDVYGRLKIMNRDHVYSMTTDSGYTPATNRSRDWIVRSTTDGIYLSNLYSVKKNPIEDINKVKVLYQATSEYNYTAANINGRYTYSQSKMVWDAPENYASGSARLVKDINAGDDEVQVATSLATPKGIDVFFGKLEGTFYVNGRYFQYEGLGFNVNGTRKYAKDEAELSQLIEENNGRPVKAVPWIKLKDTVPGSGVAVDVAADGLLSFTISGGTQTYDSKETSWILTNKGGRVSAKTDTGIKYDRLGIKYKIKSGVDFQSFAGVNMFVNGEDGYYFDIYIGDDKEEEKKQPKLRLIKKSGGNKTEIAGDLTTDNQPKRILKKDTWSFLEVVSFGSQASGWKFVVYVDGYKSCVFEDRSSPLPATTTGGFHTGGPGGDVSYFDSFFAINFPWGSGTKPEHYISSYWGPLVKTYKFNTKAALGEEAYRRYFKYLNRNFPKPGKNPKKRTARAIVKIWDFSDNATEYIREKVRFTEGPAINPRIKCTNQYVSVDSVDLTPFGGSFTIKNYSEAYQPLNGVWQQATILGDLIDRHERFYIEARSIFRQEMEHTSTAEGARGRGPESEVEIQSEWIQSTAMAKRIAEWILARWGEGSEEYTLEIFGNPLIEIGDIISVHFDATEFPDVGLQDGNNRMAVMSVAHNWDAGLSTTITVRRIK